ncbi:MAG TPA: beta-propeller fold lactonase family protein [Candidatus Sulfotelmatobacter sp.]|nr:beta-propeller fold lactonase family protein [Candidatus Sulfotelmatobacter sp.]
MKSLTVILLFASGLIPLSATAAPTMAVQVMYVENNNTIATYDVDPKTGKATQVGQPVTIASAQYLGTINSVPNGQFIYVLWTDANRENHISGYATNAHGVPNRSPFQTFSSSRLNGFEVDPDGKFAYALMSWTDSQGEMNSNIRLFAIDSSTGKLTESAQIQAHYGPDYYYSAALFGFNSRGSNLYDIYSFNFDHESGAVYSYHPVDPQTGALKPDVTIFKTSDYDSSDNVTISDKLLAQAFASCCDAWVNVYNNPPEYQNGQYVPLIHCTSSMLSQCATAQQAILDPSSKNLFMPPLNNSDTAVAHIDLTTSMLTQTATIPGWVQVIFSSYPGLLYAANWGYQANSTITSYRFDPNSGTLTEGDQLVVQAQALYAGRRTP